MALRVLAAGCPTRCSRRAGISSLDGTPFAASFFELPFLAVGGAALQRVPVANGLVSVADIALAVGRVAKHVGALADCLETSSTGVADLQGEPENGAARLGHRRDRRGRDALVLSRLADGGPAATDPARVAQVCGEAALAGTPGVTFAALEELPVAAQAARCAAWLR